MLPCWWSQPKNKQTRKPPQGLWAKSAGFRGTKGCMGRQEGQRSTRTREGLDSTTRCGGSSKQVSLPHSSTWERCASTEEEWKQISKKRITWKSNLLPSRDYGGSFQQQCFSAFIDQRNWEAGWPGYKSWDKGRKIQRPSCTPVTCAYLEEKLCCKHLNTHIDCVRTHTIHVYF